jgi:enoyl-CoA hydratase/carnithine racemase
VVGIVITGNGRGFSAGLDSQVLADITSRDKPAEATPADSDELPGLFSYLLQVPKPVIAAVNGVTAGGGFVLAAMCDVRFAAPEAAFTTVFSKRGLIAEHGTAWILPRLVGAGRALDLLWTSRKIDAEEALRIGLVEYLVPKGQDLLARVRDYVVELAGNVSPGSLADTKRLLYRQLGIGYPEALRETDEVQWEALDRPDALEGTRSFIERRPPKFARLGT